MDFISKQEKTFFRICPVGEIKTTEAGQFEEVLIDALKNQKKVILDLCRVDYIASSGLRALLAAQQLADESDDSELLLTNVHEEIMDVFRSTGFHNLLSIRERIGE